MDELQVVIQKISVGQRGWADKIYCEICGAFAHYRVKIEFGDTIEIAHYCWDHLPDLRSTVINRIGVNN